MAEKKASGASKAGAAKKASGAAKGGAGNSAFMYEASSGRRAISGSSAC